MADTFFTSDFRHDGYESTTSSSFQGQLASSYTDALHTDLMSTQNVDWIGFLAFSSGLTLEEAQDVQAQVAAGTFSLSDLFGAAQTKDGTVANPTGVPHPKLTVVIGEGEDARTVVVDLTSMMDVNSLDIESWTQTDTTGGGKKTVTTTTTHSREFYTDTAQPATYDSHWDDPPNHAPTLLAGAPDHALVEAGTTVTHVPVVGVSTATVQLTASDADGDTLTYNTTGWSTSDNVMFTKAGTYGTASLNTASGLVTYTLNSSVDLHDDVVEHDSFSMSVNDGTVSSSSVTFTFDIEGTGDWYHEDVDAIVVTKGDSVADSGSVSFATSDIEDVTVSITAIGDYDWKNEGFQVGEDVSFNFDGANNSNSTGNSSPEKLLNVAVGPASATVTVSGLADGDLDYTVTFDSQTQNDSTVTLAVAYDYWI